MPTPWRSPEGVRGSEDLDQLTRRIDGILAGLNGERAARGAIATGWPGVDAALAGRTGGLAGGLSKGSVHEWIGVSDGPSCSTRPGAWSPALSIVRHLAWRALEHSVERGVRGRILWIGRRAWPYPRTLVRDQEVRSSPLSTEPSEADAIHSEGLELARLSPAERPREGHLLLSRSLYVDVLEPAKRLWTIDAALRCPSIVAVVADAGGFDMSASRRLQLAAEAGGGLGLLVRPPRDERQLSAASTRWRVTRRRSSESAASAGPSWTLTLMRCKGVPVSRVRS